jgi:uncharacterized protein YjiS (DUF1127 family)
MLAISIIRFNDYSQPAIIAMRAPSRFVPALLMEVPMVRYSASDVSLSRLAIVRRATIGLFRQVSTLLLAMQRRSEVKHLAELDDRILKDIGLTRSDVYGALSESLFSRAPILLIRSAERETRAHERSEVYKPRPVVPVVNAVIPAGARR